MEKDSGIQDPKVIELLEIYREMDAEGKETIINAVDKLIYIQKNFKSKNLKGQNKEQLRKRRFTGIVNYIAAGVVLICTIWFFWEALLNPALLRIDITPLVMVRIITTALIGMLCLGSGFVGFLQRWIKIPLTFFLIIAGIGCMDPGILTDFIGISLMALTVTVIAVQKKREKEYFST